MHSIKLFQFFDEGGSVLIFGNSHPSGQFRKVLNQFGFDVTSSDNSSEVNRKEVQRRFISLRKRQEDPWFLLGKEDILLSGLDKGLNEGLQFKGSTINMTIYANNFSWPLIAAPQKSFHHFLPLEVLRDKYPFGIKRKILDPDRTAVLGGAQKEDVHARIAVLGGSEVFSNEAVIKSKGDNLKLFKNLVNWLQFKTNVLTVNYFRICGNQVSQIEDEIVNFKDPQKKKLRVYHDYDQQSVQGNDSYLWGFNS
jgi:hypothetical protein